MTGYGHDGLVKCEWETTHCCSSSSSSYSHIVPPTGSSSSPSHSFLNAKNNKNAGLKSQWPGSWTASWTGNVFSIIIIALHKIVNRVFKTSVGGFKVQHRWIEAARPQPLQLASVRTVGVHWVKHAARCQHSSEDSVKHSWHLAFIFGAAHSAECAVYCCRSRDASRWTPS